LKIIEKLKKNLNVKENKPVPHKNYQIKSFGIEQKFRIILSNNNENIISSEKLISLFQLTIILGGFGKRVRRGMGSLKINKYKIDNENWIENNQNINLENILDLLNNVNRKFEIANNVIKSDFKRDEKYPYIKTIEIGNSKNNLLLTISNKTNELHSNTGYKFSMGYADKYGRFASPIYVSTLNSNQAIISTLNTIPKENGFINKEGLKIQNEFKNAILK